MISAKWTLMRPHVVKLRPSVRSSSLFTSRRTAMLETEANADPDNRNGKQSALFEQLLRSGKYTTVISKFETGDPELQADHDCLKLYITALARDGQFTKIAEQVLPKRSSSSPKPLYQSRFDPITASTPVVNMKTNRAKWLQRGVKLPGSDREPIPIIVTGEFLGLTHLSEGFSWARILRQFGSKLFMAILLSTGFSVIMEQQGIIKSDVSAHASLDPVKFSDVEGVDEAKSDLEEIVQFLKHPKDFLDIGGVGARRVRELFSTARKNSPCIVFIDEIGTSFLFLILEDAVGSKRSAKDQSYMRQTLNQLLVELDGFGSSDGVIFIGATNTAESLDKALVRPGRFDHHVHVPLPDILGRKKILKIHSRNVAMKPTIDLSTVARGTPGFSGADLANLVNQAALRASKLGSRQVGLEELEWAKDKIIMGSERKSAVITEESKRLTAYHEGGHALVALFTSGATPLHKVTVIPRGNALGVTVQLPEEDVTGYTRKQLLARLDVCMGGRVAEEMILGTEEVTTGASSDLRHASSVAKGMVTQYGMSSKVGFVSHNEDELQKLSGSHKALIEDEIKMLLDEANTRAANLLQKHKRELDLLAQALMEYETLGVEEVKAIIRGEKLKRQPL
ncbi:MAG: hypothetical protein SGCHY_005494 [Lobulomycetales sp.]